MRDPKRHKPPTEPLTLREWETLPVGEGSLIEAEAARLHALAERAAQRLKLPQRDVLTRAHQELQAGQVVGVLAIPGRTVEILPKIEGENDAVPRALIHMLAVAHDLPMADGALAALATQRRDLLELIIRLFAERLLAAVRHGLPRRYVAREDDLRLLRGKLHVTRQVTHLAARPDCIACRFDELSGDTPLNRLLKAAVSRLRRVVRTRPTPGCWRNSPPASKPWAIRPIPCASRCGSTGPTPPSTPSTRWRASSSLASGRARRAAVRRVSRCSSR